MIARYSLAKLLLTLLGAAGFVVACAWMLLSPVFGDIIKFMAVVGALFFGAVAVYALVALFDRRPVLSIDEGGVFDRRSMDRKIPWSEVEGISRVLVRGKAFYYLDIGQPADRFTSHGLKRWLVNLNQGFADGLVVSPHSLDVKAKAVETALETYSPDGAAG